MQHTHQSSKPDDSVEGLMIEVNDFPNELMHAAYLMVT